MKINMPHTSLAIRGMIFPKVHSERAGKCLIADFAYILSTPIVETFSFSVSGNDVFVD